MLRISYIAGTRALPDMRTHPRAGAGTSAHVSGKAVTPACNITHAYTDT